MKKSQQLIYFSLVTAVIVVINILASYLFTRIDLTEDKRFTLSTNTRVVLSELNDVVFFKVYLEGDLPPDFRQLQNEIKDKLNEMRIYAKGNLEYEFIDPGALESDKQKESLAKQLIGKGIFPTTIQTKESDGSSQKSLFPGAVITYNNNEQSLNFIQEQIGVSDEQLLNTSIRTLEYNIVNKLRAMTQKRPHQICFLQGQGEWTSGYMGDITNELNNSYITEYKAIDGKLNALNNYRVVVIAKPDSAFDEKDKFILDQFIMKGGRVLWLYDYAYANMDSLTRADESIAIPLDLNLNDMPYRYGARVNVNMIADLQSVPIPIVMGNTGNKPQMAMRPWIYFPMIFPVSTHPLVNNLNAVKFEFCSSVDTIAVKGIRKTILLATSPYSREYNLPSRFSLEMIRKQPDRTLFNEGTKSLGVLLEGSFSSLFKNRIPPTIANDTAIGFKEEGVPTKMIVIGDGDIIKNGINKSTGKIFPCGYDRYNNRMFGNKSLILNMIDYLADDSNLIELRNKEIKLRLLNREVVKANASIIKIVNVVAPIIFLLLIGIIKWWWRRRLYASTTN
ncbi:MAG: gliding motility-associated ABC transporter substrate-binding protein GldG [Bacteroidetes bacterium]|nr:gliding motility-associated ABC transporter substrate-binding protein GldG [Bacteroidota bacterium]